MLPLFLQIPGEPGDSRSDGGKQPSFARRFRDAFAGWFASLLVLFLLLNVGGFFVPFGDAKRVATGFPCVIVEWIQIAEYRETNYYPSSILINALVSVTVSVTIAVVCASARARHSMSPSKQPPTSGVEAPLAKPSSSQPIATFCDAAKIVVLCLGVHAFAVIRWFFFSARPDWFDTLVAVFLVLSTILGVVCSIAAIRRAGLANRLAGVSGILWFGFYILLAIAQS